MAFSMKPQGAHPDKRLSVLKIQRVKEPGRYADGNGLYLIVDRTGAKRWMLRTVVQGKRRDIGLGGLALVSLAEAREQATTFRKLARQGGNPLSERQKARQIIPTFEEAARSVHEARATSWRNEKHRAQWINTLGDYAFPRIGVKRVDHIDTPDILNVLAPIWLSKPETARRVRQRLATVLDWAKAAGFRAGDNPVDGVAKGLPKQGGRDDHHAAVPYKDVAAFVIRLRQLDNSPLTKLAFEFLILTASRTNEVLKARWQEFDLENAFWEIPASCMKGKRRHIVPLSERCQAILMAARPLAGHPSLFFLVKRKQSRCRTWSS